MLGFIATNGNAVQMKASVSLDLPTLRFYAQSEQVYCASGPGGVSRNLHAFLGMLKPGACILELGCGGGRDAEAMIAAGFKVDPTDGTPEIARKAEERLGQPVRVMRFDELDAVETYDAVWPTRVCSTFPDASCGRC
jgi:hypothetical protein